MSPRYAIYFTPPPFSALARFGSGIIGYDCFDAVEVPHVELKGIDLNLQKLMTLDPRRYGFHATIVAPFHLREHSEDELIASASAYATRTAPIRIGSFAVAGIGDFVALIPAEANGDIPLLAAECLKVFNSYRAPLSAADRERRLKSGLTPHQLALMDSWGYPYVLDEYRFHMTLTGKLPERLRDEFRHALEQAFAERSGDTFELDAISVMRQDDDGDRFRVLRRCGLRG